MKSLPFDIGLIHFVGIGGIGMSGLAEILHNLGYQVQGSDLKESSNTARLNDLGIKTFVGHDAKHVEKVSAVVVSSAVPHDNPEIISAEARRLPILKRASMLAELMRMKWSIAIAGTHGKTTTTSLVGAMLEEAGLDPTVINGGIINAYNSNTKLGEGDWLVAEADESDGTFTKLPSVIACVTNIDPEHMDHYDSFEDTKRAYKKFLQNVPFYGMAIMCLDHPVVQSMIPDLPAKKVITYGFSPQADYRAIYLRYNDKGIYFDLKLKNGEIIRDVYLPMMGDHNVQNSLIACAIADQLDIPLETMVKGLENFVGVKRRFTHVGTVNGVDIIDDYGHHPVEIKAVLNAARRAKPKSKIVAVMQPHRFTRLRDLFDEFCTCFNDADSVIITDIYTAGETPIKGITRDHFVQAIKAAGHKDVQALENWDDLPSLVKNKVSEGDRIICFGAGDITKLAYDLPTMMEES